MSFDTLTYLMFLPFVALLHRAVPARLRPYLLLAASLVFYACWSVRLTLVILGVIAVTWLCGLLIAGVGKKILKKLYLSAAVLTCVGLLVWFKYLNFLGEAFSALTGGQWTPIDILLPVGCSFYTFQAMSCVIDVYRGKQPAERNILYYALYISFFPQLVAGPIERAGSLLPQLRANKKAAGEDLFAGAGQVLGGLFLKITVADTAGPVVDRVFAAAAPDGSAVILAVILFALQIYGDFWGYSMIARGSARLMGIRLRRNFEKPYAAGSVREFWRRWHMSLSEWFTDYVYIPLGGNRKGLARQIAATLTVFLLSGLWHGADWTFVLWGLWHGALCALEIALGRGGRGAAEADGKRRLRQALTAAAVIAPWLLFRADGMAQAGMLLNRVFSAWDIPSGIAVTGLTLRTALCLLGGLLLMPAAGRLDSGEKLPAMTYFYLALCAALAWFLRASGTGANAFIYFRF